MSNKVELTIFPDLSGREARAVSLSLTKLEEAFRRARPQTVKEDAPLVSGATYDERRTEKGSLRHDGNVLAVTAIIGDYDAGEVGIDEACHRAEHHKIKALFATTWSSAPEHPRWRVVSPLARPAAPSEHARYTAGLNGALGGILAPESFDLSRSYYVGGCVGAEYRVLSSFGDLEEGFALDEWDAIDAHAVYPPDVRGAREKPEPAPPLDEVIPNGRRERALTSLAGTLRRRGLVAEEILVALEAVNRRRCRPPVSDADLARIAGSVARYQPAAPIAAGGRAA